MQLSEPAEQGDLAVALSVARSDWERGWVLAAMGAYGESLRALDLVALDLAADSGAEADQQALARGTRASIYRQLALHELAERESRAALAGTADPSIRASLLVGHVADALGLGQSELWQPRVDAATIAVKAHGDWRQQVRLAWVTGETAMYRGDPGAAAPYFAEAIIRAGERSARRHEAKSHLFLAAAHAATGNRVAAAAHAQAALALARLCGARPLVWAAAFVLAEVDDGRAEHVLLARTVLSEVLAGLDSSLRQMALAREPARGLLSEVSW